MQIRVLEGMVGETKMVYDEKFLAPKSASPQRYFCEKTIPKNVSPILIWDIQN